MHFEYLNSDNRSLRYLFPEWSAPGHIKAFVTTRHGGVSTGSYSSFNMGLNNGDDPDKVLVNRARMISDWQWKRDPLWIKQVHGISVISADEYTEKMEIEADGVWSAQNNNVCVVLTADCIPVLLCNKTGGCVAAVHCGWRGLAAGILESAIKSLPDQAENIIAWLGPAISLQHFEVGDEVYNTFLKWGEESVHAFKKDVNNRWYADLSCLARQRLLSCGVLSVFGGDFCTHRQNELFYSYRKDGKSTGRMASAIWISK